MAVKSDVLTVIRRWSKTLLMLYIACASLIPVSAFADFVLTAPPRETPEAGKAIYAPLAEYLTKFLGEPVIYEHPIDWKHYEKKMKNDEYDFVFDGPHFAAWRIESKLASPLVKLPGSLRFVLVTKKSNNGINEIKHLFGKTVCTLPSPNLGALTLFSMFPQPARQPEYNMVKGGFKNVAAALDRGECDAAILRDSFYFNKTDPAFRQTTKVLQHSKELTNQGITVSQRINIHTRERLKDSLLNGEGKLALKPILNRFYGKANRFMPAQPADYKNLNLLHDNLIFGW